MTAYHHGDLRAALVEGAFALLAEVGAAGFSVAQLARRVGVSTAAPYRHFRDRDELMAAVATAAARELTAAMREAADAVGDDPVNRFAATAGAYVAFVLRRGAGFDVIFDPALRGLHDADLAEAGRALIGLLVDLAHEAGAPDPVSALRLVEQHVALAQGFVTMRSQAFGATGRLFDDDPGARVVRASAALVRGAR